MNRDKPRKVTRKRPPLGKSKTPVPRQQNRNSERGRLAHVGPAIILSANEVKALRILYACRGLPGGITAGEFARRMWPDSPSWNRTYSCGHRRGTRLGAPMPQVGGVFLSRLRKMKLASTVEGPGSGWKLLQAGIEFVQSLK